MTRDELIQQAYDLSFYTVEGAGGDLQDWITYLQQEFDQRGIGKITRWYSLTGEEVNEYFGLTGRGKYPNDFVFLIFPVRNLELGKLSEYMRSTKDKWFDTMIDKAKRM